MKHAHIALDAPHAPITGGPDRNHYSLDPVRYGGWPGKPRLLRVVGEWFDRHRQRQALKELDDFMLQDIGLTRLDVKYEIEKPFWQS